MILYDELMKIVMAHKKLFSDDDGSVDSDVCQRQAIHFLRKNDYNCALQFVEKARMAYLQSSEGDVDDQFIKIVSTQSLCLLKLGDFTTAKMFAEQVVMLNNTR